MNDLNGLDWSSSTKSATGSTLKPGVGNYNAFSSLKPTPPQSGRASPLANTAQKPVPPKSSTPANDSFSNLVGFSSSNPNKTLSLQEQQRQREQSKLQQLVGQKKQLQDQWASSDDVWNRLGSGSSTPAIGERNGTPAPASVAADEDDIFAAFNQPSATTAKTAPKAAPLQSTSAEDDDPFGLADFQAKKSAPPREESMQSLMGDDDDILGDLGRPVSERTVQRKESPARKPSPERVAVSNHPQDKAVAELVDMGFPIDKARSALEATDTGLNVQAAVGLLLNQAHEEARQKGRGRPANQSDQNVEEPTASRPRQRQESDTSHTGPAHRERSSTPSNDPSKAAQDLGSAFLKSAGSFWKQAQKQVQAVVQDFNSDTDSGASTPKWMQPDPAPKSRPQAGDEPRARPDSARRKEANVTDEALMLEAERPTPPPRQNPRSRADPRFDSSADVSRDHSPAVPSRLRDSSSPQPAFVKQQQDPFASMMRPKPQQPPKSAREMLSKQAAEDQASQAYVSSARRRRPAAPVQDEGDLLEGTTSRPVQQPLPSRPATKSAPPRPPAKPATPIQTRPPPPKRTIPSLSSIAQKASDTARSQGNAHYKRGDYSAAHESYSTSLRHIPAQHPLQIVLFTNRALTALKTGQPKLAVQDADATILLIGPSKGDSETIDVADDNGTISAKPMRDYYGKSLMRKAEALEALEKWTEAATTWRQCVEDGHGGAAAIQGRARAEKAAAPKPSPSAQPVKRTPARAATRSAPPSSISAKPAAAVNALRAQNQAAEKLDDERFALADTVSARITTWKGGKEGNLRALLASLDTVLWDGAGWKKISMADLVLPNKVKINYMKGIGKCHPDKIPTDATTEQRMIAGAVFSALNEAWDRFKAENGM